MSAISCDRRYVWRSLREMENGDRDNILGEAAEEDVIPGVQSWGCNGVDYNAPSAPERRGAGYWGVKPPHPPPREAQNYLVSLPKLLSRLRCLVEGCLGGVSSRTNLQIHFTHRHMQDKVVILEDGNWMYPRCPQCDMFASQKAVNSRNLVTDFCQRGAYRKWRRLVEEE